MQSRAKTCTYNIGPVLATFHDGTPRRVACPKHCSPEWIPTSCGFGLNSTLLSSTRAHTRSHSFSASLIPSTRAPFFSIQ